MPNLRRVCRAMFVCLVAAGAASPVAAVPAAGEPLAQELFGSQKLPAALPAQSYGFYSKGCFAGGVAMADDGPHWQAMRPSRNRHWGHPALIKVIQRLSEDAVADGWRGLLLGDFSQPRGGPMTSDHASHQIGLDADIWFMQMPVRRLSPHERETVKAISMLKRGALQVDERKWSHAQEAILHRAASYPEVERILVHPGIKKKLCETVTGDRSWLHKIRPFWGHDEHFHIRIGCPPGSPGCKKQSATPKSDGCDKSLAWWFTDEPWKPAEGPPKPKRRDVMTMASLPKECRAVLNAPAPSSVAAVTVGGGNTIEQTSASVSVRALPLADIPIPSARPTN